MKHGHYCAYVLRGGASPGCGGRAGGLPLSAPPVPSGGGAGAGGEGALVGGGAGAGAGDADGQQYIQGGVLPPHLAGRQWYYVSDDQVKAVRPAQVARAQAYILLYVRRDMRTAEVV
jgi:hypothetical protein